MDKGKYKLPPGFGSHCHAQVICGVENSMRVTTVSCFRCLPYLPVPAEKEEAAKASPWVVGKPGIKLSAEPPSFSGCLPGGTNTTQFIPAESHDASPGHSLKCLLDLTPFFYCMMATPQPFIGLCLVTAITERTAENQETAHQLCKRKSSGDWLHNNVNGINTSELYA